MPYFKDVLGVDFNNVASKKEKQAEIDAKDLERHLAGQAETRQQRAKGDSAWLWMQDKAAEIPIWWNEYPASVEKMNANKKK